MTGSIGQRQIGTIRRQLEEQRPESAIIFNRSGRIEFKFADAATSVDYVKLLKLFREGGGADVNL